MSPAPSRIKAKLRQNKPVLLTTLHLGDPSLFELTSLLGFDGIWFDLEHRSFSLERAADFARATPPARLGGHHDPPRQGRFVRMGRVLEIGASGIMYPRCDNAEEAKQVVNGQSSHRSASGASTAVGPIIRTAWRSLVEYIHAANDETFIVIQIEDPRALEHADAMAAVEGVDILFLGPGDFSILGGVPARCSTPRFARPWSTVASAAKKAGKHWGMPIFNTEHAQQVLQLGGRFLCHGCDLLMVKAGLEAMQRQFEPLGVTFERRI